jgi:hypothetical protein
LNLLTGNSKIINEPIYQNVYANNVIQSGNFKSGHMRRIHEDGLVALEAKRLEQLKQSEYQSMVNRLNRLQYENDRAQKNTASMETKVKKLMEIRQSHYEDAQRKLKYYDQLNHEK